MDLKSYICLHLKQKNTEEAVTAHKLATDSKLPHSPQLPQQCQHSNPGLIGNIHIPQNVFRVLLSKCVQAAGAAGTGAVLYTVILIQE